MNETDGPPVMVPYYEDINNRR